VTAFALTAVQGLLLCWARWFGVLLVAPTLAVVTGGRHVLSSLAIAGVLATVDAARVSPLPPRDGLGLALGMAAELVLGMIVGVLVAWAAAALVGAAASSAAILRVPAGPWLVMIAALVLAAAMQLGLHHTVMQASTALHVALPLGDPQAWLGMLGDSERWVAWGGGMLALALALATPAVLVAATCDLVTAAIARGPTAASALATAGGSTLRLGAVLVALAASWSIDLPRWAAHALPTSAPVVDAAR
jgi:hypothetical protein